MVKCRLDLSSAIKTRRSIRKFKPDKAPEKIIMEILDLARWAPSAHNAQPWRCIVINDESLKEKLAKAMGKAWLSDLIRDGIPEKKAQCIIRLESWERITQSPIVIIVCLTMKDMHKYPDKRRRAAEYVMGVQSVAAYIQTLLLAAHYHGLGACWMCAPLFCKEAVKKALSLPKDLEPQAMIVMGYSSEKPEPPLRKSLEEICSFNIWHKN